MNRSKPTSPSSRSDNNNNVARSSLASGYLAAINSFEVFPLPLRLSLISYGARSSPLSGLSSCSSPLSLSLPLSGSLAEYCFVVVVVVVVRRFCLNPNPNQRAPQLASQTAGDGENFLPSRDPPLIRLLGRNLQNRGETWFSDGSFVRWFSVFVVFMQSENLMIAALPWPLRCVCLPRKIIGRWQRSRRKGLPSFSIKRAHLSLSFQD